MIIRFWGVRGSAPSGNRGTAGVGGNTTCVEVRCGDELIIFDSGTGIRNLGMKLLGEMPIKGHIFYSHVHRDHIQGFPFFIPLYIPGNEFDIYGGTSLPTPIEEVLNQQMTPPCFPVKMDTLGAKINYHGIKPGNVIEGENFKVTLAPLYHPNGSYGYRIDYDGRSIVFATDCEHREGKLCEGLSKLCENTDLLIYDAQYTEAEYYGKDGQMPRIGWGHSTWNEAVKMAEAAKVDRLILFHHDPSHNDDFVKKIEADAREVFPRSMAAFEGLEVDVSQPDLPPSMFD